MSNRIECKKPDDAPILALRPSQAARAMGVSPRTLWSLTADRGSGIPFCRLGRCVRYPVRELERWLAERAAVNAAG